MRDETITKIQHTLSRLEDVSDLDLARTQHAPNTLAKQLIVARMHECDAMLKLRVASRVEVDLRDTIVARDARITQLKQQKGIRTSKHSKLSSLAIRLLLAQAEAQIAALKRQLAMERATAQAGTSTTATSTPATSTAAADPSMTASDLHDRLLLAQHEISTLQQAASQS